MKKKPFAALLLLVPLTALCACGSTATVPVKANWYRSPQQKGILSTTDERLEYDVTFESTGNSDYSLAYDTGKYTTALTAEKVTYSSGETELSYHLHTELSITGRYTVHGETGEDFSDSVISDVWFLDVETHLRPVKSEKQVKCTLPQNSPATLEDAYKTYEYTYSVEYDTALRNAEIGYTQTAPEEKSYEKTVSISDNTNFFDNEQILFMMRGLTLTSTVSFSTINPLNDSQTTGVAIATAPERTALSDYKFVMDGAEVTKSIDAYKFGLSYQNSNPGREQTFVYAADTYSEGKNQYCNVMLKMSVPVLYNLGTLNYSLVSADFTN